ncbi:hypothetical protein SAMN02745247_00047 [Butyrivibrio hungatei DSM 14810]|uniref:Uncharacterized protein n=1 Tax=Butyrivibrio hungatei DSM 14810 TaxID=1121132 RepID=A0A1M7RQM4_9FIRM|nr:hypothetical protein [Butyrivibrio hungatei]SHN48471.1 hypothetical protein SAMN02745247_00047 [Butyrivibrio hungatei DSM 14810]
MGDIISITLDPTKDGIVGKVDTMVATSGKYVVIGTNAEHRFISEKQFDAYTDELGKDDRLGLLIVKDFMIYYDKSKLIEVDDCKYLIGSFLLVEISTDGTGAYSRLGEGDVECVKKTLSDYCADLIVDGERYSALCVD